MTANLSVILGVEALCAAQGIEHRAPLPTSARLQAAMDALRAHVPPLGPDRYLASEIETAAALVRDDTLAAAAGLELAL
jgi:histidine ammonia-lyase